MSTMTINISSELALRLRPFGEEMPQILELGLREWSAAGQVGFPGAAEILEFLASLPSPQAILALRPSAALQGRIGELLEKNRAHGLTPAEEKEWAQYEFLEHITRMAKARALIKLREYTAAEVRRLSIVTQAAGLRSHNPADCVTVA